MILKSDGLTLSRHAAVKLLPVFHHCVLKISVASIFRKSYFLFSEVMIMTTVADPIVGSWYKDVENNLTFKIVNIEDSDDSIEVQYVDGDIGEYDHESWYNSTFDYIEEPEDWSAPFDDIESDDLGYSDTDEHRPNPEDMDIDDYLD
jgi:hypothetical protein